jgi:peptidoglycan hydrolase-like protein with peptidoglycan-binding domain
MDRYGRRSYIIPANQSVDIVIKLGVQPKDMFAGQYTFNLKNLYSPDSQNQNSLTEIPTNAGTNAVTIVGESAVITVPPIIPLPNATTNFINGNTQVINIPNTNTPLRITGKINFSLIPKTDGVVAPNASDFAFYAGESPDSNVFKLLKPTSVAVSTTDISGNQIQPGQKLSMNSTYIVKIVGDMELSNLNGSGNYKFWLGFINLKNANNQETNYLFDSAVYQTNSVTVPKNTPVVSYAGAVKGAFTVCTQLTHALTKGSMDIYSDGEVTLLQEFLETQGYSTPDKGVFGPVTFEMLKSWQFKNSIQSTGVTGPATRDLIEQISCK